MAKNLVIVESPAKAKTIERILGKDFTVKSSFGHVRDLPKKNMGIDIEKDFLPSYEITPDKKKTIKELKALSKKAEYVWLATDEDREGEAISWHLKEVLEINNEKIRRITFHEITKNAILQAIENPRDIDTNLVNAQQARRVLDRIVGFEISPILWKKVKPSLSAGRVQSVAVRLIVEKEREIEQFQSQAYYKVIGAFNTEGQKGQLKADLSQNYESKDEAIHFLEHCENAIFKIKSVEKKPGKRSPAPPFITSTLQQEASRKLGYSVAKTMMVAQQLYEAGKITYMRTDSVNMSNVAIAAASRFIKEQYGDQYVKTRKYQTKAKGAQEAHEAIRPTDMSRASTNGDPTQQKLYELIWKRAIASQMADAILEKTNIKISVSGASEFFEAKGEVVSFDGFLKVYFESTDNENGDISLTGTSLLPAVKQNDLVIRKEISATQRYTKHPPRYTEASLVRKLEELGIGRPSTYAPTISTIQKREYVEKYFSDGISRDYEHMVLIDNIIETHIRQEKVGAEKGKLKPTDIGSVVNDFLTQHFEKILDYHFTAKVEQEFDAIASGNRIWNNMIKDFYQPFHDTVEDTIQNSERAKGEKLIGVDPESGKNVYAKIGRFGPMVQIGEISDEEKPRFAGLLKNQSISSISLEEALELFKLPRVIGLFEGKEITAAVGRFGPYIKHANKFVSLGKDLDPHTVDLKKSIELIEAKRKADKEKLIKVFDEDKTLQVLNGRYGPYLKKGRTNYKLPKGKKPDELTYEECLEIIEKAGKKKNSRKK